MGEIWIQLASPKYFNHWRLGKACPSAVGLSYRVYALGLDLRFRVGLEALGLDE